MTPKITDLINEAGFSSTFEKDRLEKLCKLTVVYCIQKYAREAKMVLVERELEQEFGIDRK